MAIIGRNSFTPYSFTAYSHEIYSHQINPYVYFLSKFYPNRKKNGKNLGA